MLDLFPELGFRDNLKPSQVTHKVRSELIEVEQRARNRMLFVPFLIAGVADLFLYGTVSGKGLAALPWAQILLWELLGVAAAVAAMFWFYRGRIEFLRNALVTPAAVMEIDRTSVWLFGRRSQSPRPAARKVGRSKSQGRLGAVRVCSAHCENQAQVHSRHPRRFARLGRARRRSAALRRDQVD
jgi:hypothetical protein